MRNANLQEADAAYKNAEKEMFFRELIIITN